MYNTQRSSESKSQTVPQYFFSYIPKIQSMLCSFVQANDREKGEIMDNGLVKGHGYGVTDVKSIKLAKTLQKQLGSSTIQLVRLRNPWGTKEWNGSWSDE